MNSIFNNLILLSICSYLLGCAASQPSVGRQIGDRQYLTLAEYLQSIPGLQVSYQREEPTITVRGLQSLEAEQEPLYIVDGVQIGNSYARAVEMVDPNDVRSVTVLKDVASTSAYGLRGSNGVIVIKTKAGN